MNEPLTFDISIGRTKPINIRNEQIKCPFCDTKNLTDILATDGNIIWLMNKYPVLKNTWPTVIIETDDDRGEFTRYTAEQATRVIHFGLEKWQETMSRSEFKSVIFFKNHGPMSGGSIRHPHSQIIGLRDYDYRQDIRIEHMNGWLLHEDRDIRITLSNRPLIGFFEYNLRFSPATRPGDIARRLQQVLRYVLTASAQFTQSYNYFFYDLNDGYYYIKVVSRYISPPLYVGYKIPQTCGDERAAKIIEDITPYLS